MDKNEMKNRISMALKDPILQQGFEIICKNLAELEKENKVLAQNLEDTEILNKTYEKRFDDLKKENAELKKLKRECETSLCRAEYQYNYEQLTKAKEIIKELMSFSVQLCDCRHTVDFEKTREEAEQFLSKVEK